MPTLRQFVEVCWYANGLSTLKRAYLRSRIASETASFQAEAARIEGLGLKAADLADAPHPGPESALDRGGVATHRWYTNDLMREGTAHV